MIRGRLLMRCLRRLGILVLGLASSWLVPDSALACGGFFQGPIEERVVNQNAERIVFSRTEDSVSAYIQIRYEGDPADFAWIIPVMTRPQLDVADPALFDVLDWYTAPTFRFPRPGGGGGGGGGGLEFGCGGSASRGMDGGDDDMGGDADADGDTVAVWGEENVGPFSTAVITADEPEDLTRWLEDHEYRIPEEGYGIIAEYVEEGYFFVAVRLQADAGTDLIQPLVITYQGTEPCVPLRLTQVAAVPDLPVYVWIVADEQAYPYNYARAFVDDRQVVRIPGGTTNYLDLVSEVVNAAGEGRAFVTEYAQPTERLPNLSQPFGDYYYGPTQEGSQEAEDIVRSGDYITRLYTQIDPQEMTLDPIFEFDADLADVSNIHDLTEPGASAGLTPRRGSALAFALSGGAPIVIAIGLLFRRRRR
jgi:hypothetical protein